MSKRFIGPYRRQNWSLPDSIIYYMAKNPSNPKVYQKMKKCCKYFLIKNPIIVLSCLHFTKDGWKTCAFTKQCNGKLDEMRKIDVENISSKVWILDTFDLCQDLKITPPTIISKIYKCQVKACYLSRQSITLNQLLFLASSATSCALIECVVKDDKNISPLLLEEIVANLPKLQNFCVDFIPNAPNISSKTVKELLKLPHFSNITELTLFYLSELFDLDTLFEYFKNTNDMFLNLNFCYSISDAFKNHIDALVDQILATPSPTYRTPYLSYRGQNQEKRDILYERFLKDCP